MPIVEFEDRHFAVAPGQSVLDTLLRNGVQVPHSCKAGTCGSCMMRASAGQLPANSQAGLKASWKAQGFFLPCVCQPEVDLAVTPVATDARVDAAIIAMDLLSPDVLRVRLRCDAALQAYAGQFVTVITGMLARSYSIACLPGGLDLELHVRKIAQGKMSGWFHHEARIGDRVTVLGPFGECFYVPGTPNQPLLLVGTGTGLAPLYGILLDALRSGHCGPIHLFHGAVQKRGLYLMNELRKLVSSHPHVEYTPTVLEGSEAEGLAVGPIDQVVPRHLPKLNGWRAYLCGDPALVRSLKKKVFLAGVASRDIYADAFVPAA